ncbi:hypothetical protein DPMN_148385 [Dreissena polymorpha]|uniref:Uncharacterized protein n=1 Tax=Dreissena polymorpha TaxID=45954 RepID=A0A9D4FAS0_DREPO|nr:hypothetical protein DPMN_148385 [Dreissena polymorpha]
MWLLTAVGVTAKSARHSSRESASQCSNTYKSADTFLFHVCSLHFDEHILPASAILPVEAVWLEHTSAALTAIKEEGRSVTLAGDGRCESPGHCAKYGTYSLIDMATGHVIGLHLVQVRHWS